MEENAVDVKTDSSYPLSPSNSKDVDDKSSAERDIQPQIASNHDRNKDTILVHSTTINNSDSDKTVVIVLT